MVSAIGLCMLAAQLAVATPTTPATETAVQKAVVASVELDSSQRTLALINRERAVEDLPPLKWNEQLAQAAQRHAELLARRQQLSHRFSDEAPLQQRLANAGVLFARAGENVAVNYNAQGAHVAFMNSPGHRANILNGHYDEVGVAVVKDRDLLYFVEDFAQQRAIQSDTEAVQSAAERFEEMGRQAGAPALQQVDVARVQDWACTVAQEPSSAAEGAAGLGAKFVLVFSAAEPDRFPGQVGWLKQAAPGDRFAIGVCFSQSPRYPAGRYFVTVALFAPDMPLPRPEQPSVDASLAKVIPALEGSKPE